MGLSALRARVWLGGKEGQPHPRLPAFLKLVPTYELKPLPTRLPGSGCSAVSSLLAVTQLNELPFLCSLCH